MRAAAGGDSAKAAELVGNGLRARAVLSGHVGRVAGVAFSPSGAHVGTAGYDKTWRLWDVARAEEILLQEGHAREVFAIAFHPDGSLIGTGDLSGLGRVWDLRSGKAIFSLRGHASALLALDWSKNGFHVASASEDATSCVWDLRAQRQLYTIPAHTKLVSAVKFSPTTSELLYTASYDGTVKTWSARDWAPVKTSAGHDARVTGLDVFECQGSPEGEAFFVSASFDRKLKVWGPDAPDNRAAMDES